MIDRHRAAHIPFRCSQDMQKAIKALASSQHRPQSEVLRNLVDKGLSATGAKAEEGELYQLIQRAVNEAMKPQVERLAAIGAKAANISGAAYFMSIYTATLNCTPAEQRQIEEAAGTARELGIQYLKLKNRNIDDFIQEGVKRITEEE